jgi:argininosuccinate lyase
MRNPTLVLVESNTTGTGRDFCIAARQLGYRPVVLARDPTRYDYLTREDIDTVQTDTTDDASLRATVRTLGDVAGVASSSEYFIAAAARLAVSLGRAAPDPAAVQRCRDKLAQLAVLRRTGVPAPPGRSATNITQAVAAATTLGYPVVVKPRAGSGSVGVRRCDHPEQVAAHAAQLFTTQATTILVQRHVTGPEYSVEVFDGHAMGIIRKHVTDTGEFVETGHDFPAPVATAVADSASQTAEWASRALGLGWGAVHVEMRLTPSGPQIIEVNPRLAGGMIPRVISAAAGIDLVRCVIGAAVGRTADLTPRWQRGAAIRFLVAPRSGTLAGITGLDEAATMPGVVEVGALRPEGDLICREGSFRDRVAYVIASARTTADAADRCTAALGRLGAQWRPTEPSAEPAAHIGNGG